MRAKLYRIHLTQDEENQLRNIVDQGMEPARQVTRARILLMLNEGTGERGARAPEQREVAEQCRCHSDLVYKVSRQYVKEGLERVLNRKKRETPPRPAKVTGEVEAKLLELSRGKPPPGYNRWTLRLLEERSKEALGIELSDTTIRSTLKRIAARASGETPPQTNG
jgi:transposase